MKALGIVLIIFVSFLLGYGKRSEQLKGERLTELFSDLFGEIKYQISYSGNPLTEILISLSSTEKYSKFNFISDALNRLKNENKPIANALVEAFDGSAVKAVLSGEERECVQNVFSDFAKKSKEREVEKLEEARRFFLKSAEDKRAANDKKRGYYETLYTLAGTVIAIILA
ncbi:MAG: hypothetical protein GX683_06835 [Ruminococcaceae bacterium]|nr:hypothetical protein [Oscillospiraceae bacterium]